MLAHCEKNLDFKKMTLTHYVWNVLIRNDYKVLLD